MKSKQRRAAILEYLKQNNNSITGGQLSEKFNVTRQVIVGDIALLRAKGAEIIGTPQGYLYSQTATNKAQIKIAATHSSDHDQIREELYLIVDHGATVQDVIVDHPIYGQITANLHVTSRYDADQFIDKLSKYQAEPLLVLTDGLHLHTITADNMDTLERVNSALAKSEFLAK